LLLWSHNIAVNNYRITSVFLQLGIFTISFLKIQKLGTFTMVIIRGLENCGKEKSGKIWKNDFLENLETGKNWKNNFLEKIGKNWKIFSRKKSEKWFSGKSWKIRGKRFIASKSISFVYFACEFFEIICPFCILIFFEEKKLVNKKKNFNRQKWIFNLSSFEVNKGLMRSWIVWITDPEILNRKIFVDFDFS